MGLTKICLIFFLFIGVAVIQLVESFWKHAESFPAFSEVPTACGSHLPPPERLEWVLEANDLKKIEEAALVLNNLVKDLDFQVIDWCSCGVMVSEILITILTHFYL